MTATIGHRTTVAMGRCDPPKKRLNTNGKVKEGWLPYTDYVVILAVAAAVIVVSPFKKNLPFMMVTLPIEWIICMQ